MTTDDGTATDSRAATGEQTATDDQAATDDQPTAGGRGGLVVEADLTVGLPDSTLQLHSDAGRLYLDAPGFDALDELRTTATSDAIDWLLARGSGGPLRVETPVVVRVREVPVARYHPTAPPGRLAEWLGIDPFRADITGALTAVLRGLRR